MGKVGAEELIHREWCAGASLMLCLTFLSLPGCVAQQADMKTTERQLQKSIKQSTEEMAQRNAQQREELEEIKGQDLPKLRGDIDQIRHQAQTLHATGENLKQRVAVLEQQPQKLDPESSARYSQVRESLNAMDARNKSDRDQLRAEVNDRLDSLDVVIGRILLRLEELEKRSQPSKK